MKGTQGTGGRRKKEEAEGEAEEAGRPVGAGRRMHTNQSDLRVCVTRPIYCCVMPGFTWFCLDVLCCRFRCLKYQGVFASSFAPFQLVLMSGIKQHRITELRR